MKDGDLLLDFLLKQELKAQEKYILDNFKDTDDVYKAFFIFKNNRESGKICSRKSFREYLNENSPPYEGLRLFRDQLRLIVRKFRIVAKWPL